MQFGQVAEMTTDKFDELDTLDQKCRANGVGQRTTTSEWVRRYHEDLDRYVIGVVFDSRRTSR